MSKTDTPRALGLITWLRKRGDPDSGIRYSSRGHNGMPEVTVHGTDAAFIKDNFHGQGARDLADALSELLPLRASPSAPKHAKKPLTAGWLGYWPGAGSINSETKITRWQHEAEAWRKDGATVTELVERSTEAPPPSARPWESMSCDDQYMLARKIAANVGYALMPESSIQDAEDKSDDASHVKRGTEYVLLGYGKMQSSHWLDGTGHHVGHHGLVDMREVAIYRAVIDGSLWARPREEFEDGRFVALAAPPIQGNSK